MFKLLAKVNFLILLCIVEQAEARPSLLSDISSFIARVFGSRYQEPADGLSGGYELDHSSPIVSPVNPSHLVFILSSNPQAGSILTRA